LLYRSLLHMDGSFSLLTRLCGMLPYALTPPAPHCLRATCLLRWFLTLLCRLRDRIWFLGLFGLLLLNLAPAGLLHRLPCTAALPPFCTATAHRHTLCVAIDNNAPTTASAWAPSACRHAAASMDCSAAAPPPCFWAAARCAARTQFHDALCGGTSLPLTTCLHGLRRLLPHLLRTWHVCAARGLRLAHLLSTCATIYAAPPYLPAYMGPLITRDCCLLRFYLACHTPACRLRNVTSLRVLWITCLCGGSSLPATPLHYRVPHAAAVSCCHRLPALTLFPATALSSHPRSPTHYLCPTAGQIPTWTGPACLPPGATTCLPAAGTATAPTPPHHHHLPHGYPLPTCLSTSLPPLYTHLLFS